MLGLLELGTNSLKLHLGSREPDPHAGAGDADDAALPGGAELSPGGARMSSEPLRVEWQAGFDVCSTGRLASPTMDEAVAHLRHLLECGQVESFEGVFGVATGVFDESDNAADFLRRVQREFGVPVRVLTGAEQAKLLHLGFADEVGSRPAVVFDLGCGRLETVHLGAGAGTRYLHESLPLGVMRVHQVASRISGELDAEAARRFIEVKLRGSKSFELPVIYGTGGTVRLLSQVCSTTAIRPRDLERLEEEIRANGPPRFLSPRRQSIFLPGILVVRHLLEHFGAEVLEYRKIDLGLVLIERLRQLHATHGSRLRRVFIDREIDIFSW